MTTPQVMSINRHMAATMLRSRKTLNLTSSSRWRLKKLWWQHPLVHPDSSNLLFFYIFSATCYYSWLFHHANLHYVYVCFPMRSHKKGHMWAQLQSTEPWSQRTKAQPYHWPDWCSLFIQNVLLWDASSVHIVPHSTLPSHCRGDFND